MPSKIRGGTADLALADGRILRPSALVGMATAAASNFWEAGGATGCIAAYQPKGAASLAASYVNLANPGTYDAAPGVAPTHAGATGWTFNGSTQYLTTGILASAITWTAIVQFANHVSAIAQCIIGAYEAAGQNFFIQDQNTEMQAGQGGFDSNAPGMTNGNYAIAGKTAYRNGVAEATPIPAGGAGMAANALFIAGDNISYLFNPWAGDIIAIAIYNNTLSAGQVAALAAAMAAL